MTSLQMRTRLEELDAQLDHMMKQRGLEEFSLQGFFKYDGRMSRGSQWDSAFVFIFILFVWIIFRLEVLITL
jgi:hypothetical protein